MAEDTYFQGTVPPANNTNIRDAAYRAFRLNVPIETYLTSDPANLVDQNYASATGTYPRGLSGQSPYGGNVLYVLGRYYHSVQVYHLQASAISVQIEGSLDGINWVSIGSAITGDGITTFTGIYKYIRASVNTLTLTGGPGYTTPYGVRIAYIGLAQQ